MAEETKLNLTDDGKLCQIAKTILDTPGFVILLISEIIFGFIAALLNTLLLRVIWRVTIFNANLRILLIHFSFHLLWYSLCYAIKAALLLPRLFGVGDPCAMKMLMFDCRVQEIPSSIPVQLAVYGELAISLERLYSSIRYKNSDHHERTRNLPILATILIFLCYVIPMINIVTSLLKMPPSQMVAVCENLLSLTSSSALTSLVNNLSALVVSMTCVICVWYWNGYKLRAVLANKAKHTLSSRFQIDQNMQINKIIVPDMIFQLCCYIPNYVFMILIIFGLTLNYEMKTILIHANYLWKVFYAAAHPAIVMTRNAHVRKRVKEIMPSFFLKIFDSKQEPSPIIAMVAKEQKHQTNTHFQILEDAWNMK